jgi:hypothetical protein
MFYRVTLQSPYIKNHRKYKHTSHGCKSTATGFGNVIILCVTT